MSADRTPILLANADYYGTLAATRSLGEQGVPVYVASDQLLAAARWSRHAALSVSCPPMDESERFIDWLLRFGQAHPGTVLCATGDETAFLYALRAAELGQVFRMYQPGLDAILHVLDKRRLYATAQSVGLEIPETWFPQSDADVERLSRELPMPLLIKPRTQVLSRTHSKGVIVTDKADLLRKYREFVTGARYGRELIEAMPDAAQAMIQRYVPGAASQIHVLAAFADRAGTLFAARSGTKILQRPRRLGIGLCFEAAEVDPRVSEGARKLAHRAGYFGVLQLEFIRDPDHYMLIDYNPRLYNQLRFRHRTRLANSADDVRVSSGRARRGREARLRRQSALRRPRACLLQHLRHEHDAVGPAIGRAGLGVRGAPLAAMASLPWRFGHRILRWPRTIRSPPWWMQPLQLYGYARHPRAFMRKVVFDRTML